MPSGNNVFIKTINLGTPGWLKVHSEPLVVSCTVLAPSGNDQNIRIRYDGGDDARLGPGDAVRLVRVDVSLLEVTGGTIGDAISVVGGSW